MNFVPLLVLDRFQGLPPCADAGVVDEDVDLPEPADDVFHEHFDLAAFCQIDFCEEALPPQGLHFFHNGCAVGVAATDRHVRTGLGRAASAACRPNPLAPPVTMAVLPLSLNISMAFIILSLFRPPALVVAYPLYTTLVFSRIAATILA